MKIIIHRGAQEIGGSCVELFYRDSTILLDVGLPLDFDFSDHPERHVSSHKCEWCQILTGCCPNQILSLISFK